MLPHTAASLAALHCSHAVRPALRAITRATAEEVESYSTMDLPALLAIWRGLVMKARGAIARVDALDAQACPVPAARRAEAHAAIRDVGIQMKRLHHLLVRTGGVAACWGSPALTGLAGPRFPLALLRWVDRTRLLACACEVTALARCSCACNPVPCTDAARIPAVHAVGRGALGDWRVGDGRCRRATEPLGGRHTGCSGHAHPGVARLPAPVPP
jgi:hypothetical protein